MNYCIKCASPAIDEDGFCFAHSSNPAAMGAAIDRAELLRDELRDRALFARMEAEGWA